MPELIRSIHTDGADGRPLTAALSAFFRVEALPLSAIDTVDDLSAAALIVDVDLSDAATVRRLRRRLPKRGDLLRAMVVSAEARSERVQAGVLGANVVIARPFDPARVAADLDRASRCGRLDTDLGRGRVPDGAPGGASIRAAEAVLADLFSACLGVGDVDVDLLQDAGRQIAGSIAEIGHEAWMDTVRRHHDGTYQHCLLVSGIAVGFGTELGLSGADVERLARAALGHDIGKARVPIALLDKPGKLTEAEFTIVRCHPEWGWALLRAADRLEDPAILDAVLHHHEALDGSGYPHGLAGARIADLTRILTICDIYGALSERRAYKPPMRPPQIMEVLHDMAAKGKVEAALVRALGWIVSGERPSVFASPRSQRRRA